jgi:hypothetical protein
VAHELVMTRSLCLQLLQTEPTPTLLLLLLLLLLLGEPMLLLLLLLLVVVVGSQCTCCCWQYICQQIVTQLAQPAAQL